MRGLSMSDPMPVPISTGLKWAQALQLSNAARQSSQFAGKKPPASLICLPPRPSLKARGWPLMHPFYVTPSLPLVFLRRRAISTSISRMVSGYSRMRERRFCSWMSRQSQSSMAIASALRWVLRR